MISMKLCKIFQEPIILIAAQRNGKLQDWYGTLTPLQRLLKVTHAQLRVQPLLFQSAKTFGC